MPLCKENAFGAQLRKIYEAELRDFSGVQESADNAGNKGLSETPNNKAPNISKQLPVDCDILDILSLEGRHGCVGTLRSAAGAKITYNSSQQSRDRLQN